MLGDPLEKIKQGQIDALRRLYRNQIINVIITFCLMRNRNLINSTYGTKLKNIDIPIDLIIELYEESCLDPLKIIKALNLITGEEAIQKLHAIMDEIHDNCMQIAKNLGIAFNEEKLQKKLKHFAELPKAD